MVKQKNRLKIQREVKAKNNAAALQRRKTILIKNFLATADPHQTDTRLSLNKNRLCTGEDS